MALVEKLNYYMFDRFFYPYFGFHSICVGMVLLYAPYGFEIAIVWIHFILYIVMLFFKIKFGEDRNRFIFVIYIIC